MWQGDADGRGAIRWLVDEMKRSPDAIDPALSLFSAVRHLERIADHATNIAEDVVYLYEGRDIRHTGKGKVRLAEAP